MTAAARNLVRPALVVLIALVCLSATPAMPGHVSSSAPSGHAWAVHSAAPGVVAGSVGTWSRSDTAGSPWPSKVLATFLPNYNASLPGNFRASVQQLRPGVPIFLGSPSVAWWPLLPVAAGHRPLPPIGPTLLYSTANGSVEGVLDSVPNASALLLDPASGIVYAAQALTNSLAAFWAANGSAAGPPIPVGTYPDALALDPRTHELFVANYLSNTVTILNLTSGLLADPGVQVGSHPVALVDDPADGLVYVANAGSSNLTVLRASSPTSPPTSVGLFDGPAVGLAYSGASGTIAAVEPLSRYMTTVQANTSAVIDSLISVGTGQAAVATSVDGTSFVVANGSGAAVNTVLSSIPFTVASTPIPTDLGPSVLAVDPASGQVLVWSSGDRTISEVNLTSRSVESRTPTLGPLPSLLAYDGTTGRLLVSDGALPGVEALDPFSGRTVAQFLTLPGLPTDLVLGPGNGTLYVCFGPTVTAYNASSGAFLRETNLTGPAGPLLADPHSGVLWVGDRGNGTVLALNLSSLAPVAGTGPLAVDPTHPDALTLDPLTDTVAAVNLSALGSVRLFNGTNGRFLGPNVYLGPNVTSVAFDPADGLVYAAGDTLSAIDPGSLQVEVAAASLGPNARVAALAYDALHDELLTHRVDPTGNGWAAVVDGASPAVANTSLTLLTTGLGNGSIAFAPSYAGALPGAGTAFLANDASGTVSVLGSALSLAAFPFGPDPVDSGSTASGTLVVRGGSGPVRVSSELPAWCTLSSGLALTCRAGPVGVYALSVNLTDAYGQTLHVTTNLTVVPALSVTFSVGSPPSNAVDVGALAPFSATGHGGTPPYSFSWTFGDGSTGQGASVHHAYSSPGIVPVLVEVTDASGASARAAQALTVVAAPSVRLVGLPASLVTDVGVDLRLTADVSGGVGNGTGTWTFGDGNSSSGLSADHHWSRAGTFPITFHFTDAQGVETGAAANLTVHAPLSGTFTTSPAGSSFGVGEDVEFVAEPTDGTAGYSASWSFGDGSSGSGLSVHHPYARAGTYTVNVTLTDAAGGAVSTTFTVTVTEASPLTAGILSSGEGSAIVLGAILGGTVAAIGLYAAERSKHRRPPRPPVPFSSGPTPPPEP